MKRTVIRLLLVTWRTVIEKDTGVKQDLNKAEELMAEARRLQDMPFSFVKSVGRCCVIALLSRAEQNTVFARLSFICSVRIIRTMLHIRVHVMPVTGSSITAG